MEQQEKLTRQLENQNETMEEQEEKKQETFSQKNDLSQLNIISKLKKYWETYHSSENMPVVLAKAGGVCNGLTILWAIHKARHDKSFQKNFAEILKWDGNSSLSSTVCGQVDELIKSIIKYQTSIEKAHKQTDLDKVVTFDEAGVKFNKEFVLGFVFRPKELENTLQPIVETIVNAGDSKVMLIHTIDHIAGVYVNVDEKGKQSYSLVTFDLYDANSEVGEIQCKDIQTLEKELRKLFFPTDFTEYQNKPELEQFNIAEKAAVAIGMHIFGCSTNEEHVKSPQYPNKRDLIEGLLSKRPEKEGIESKDEYFGVNEVFTAAFVDDVDTLKILSYDYSGKFNFSSSGKEVFSMVGQTGGEEPSVSSRKEFTPLLKALEIGNIAAAEFLMKSTQQTLDENNPETIATFYKVIANGLTESVKIFLQNNISPFYALDVMTVSNLPLSVKIPSITPFSAAIQSGRADIVNTFYENCDVVQLNNYNPLHVAAKYGKKEVVQYLLERQEIDVNAHDEQGETPLLLAIKRGNDDVAMLLIKRGYGINITNLAGETPLHVACTNGKQELVSALLLNSNINVNAKDMEWKTPLHLAVQRKDSTMVKMLLEKGADINAKDISGETPLALAKRLSYYDITETLEGKEKLDVKMEDVTNELNDLLNFFEEEQSQLEQKKGKKSEGEEEGEEEERKEETSLREEEIKVVEEEQKQNVSDIEEQTPTEKTPLIKRQEEQADQTCDCCPWPRSRPGAANNQYFSRRRQTQSSSNIENEQEATADAKRRDGGCTLV